VAVGAVGILIVIEERLEPVIEVVAAGALPAVMVGVLVAVFAAGVTGMVKKSWFPGTDQVARRTNPIVMFGRGFRMVAAGAVGQSGMIKAVNVPICNIGVAAHAGALIMNLGGVLQMAGFAVQDVAVGERDILPVFYICVAAHTLTRIMCLACCRAVALVVNISRHITCQVIDHPVWLERNIQVIKMAGLAFQHLGVIKLIGFPNVNRVALLARA